MNLREKFHFRHRITPTVLLCKVCHSPAVPFETAYGKLWHRCPECAFLQAQISEELLRTIERGEGFVAGTGVGGGGYREYWISKLCLTELKLRRILIYGTGNTPTFQKLLKEGFDVYGCDISANLVKARQEKFGNRFFHATNPPQVKFDGIVAVEVLEHLVSPRRTFSQFRNLLVENGTISGTTDFYPGGSIAQAPYLQPKIHIAYWSEQSLRMIAREKQQELALFELQRPGSVYPDEKFGLLWPNKRVFFLHSPEHTSFFKNLAAKHDILPIDRP